MQLKHMMLALVVAFTWGLNFIVTKLALDEMPLFLLLGVRFILTSLPFVFFIPRPKEISWLHLTGLSLTLYVLKFSFVFGSMAVGLSPGIASLALQTQAIFTMIFSSLIFKSKVSAKQTVGMAVAFSGMLAIGLEQHGSASFLGFILVIIGAIMWGFANILLRGAKNTNAFALTIWMGVIPPLPMLGASIYVDSYDLVVEILKNLSLQSYLALAYIVIAASWIGATCWNYLFKKYDAAVVAPYSLMIPVFGITCSWLFLGEKYSSTTILACLVVLTGLAINQFPSRRGKVAIATT